VVGIAVTFLSGLTPSPLSYVLIGAAQWGIPLPWMTQAIYPNAPKTLHWGEFIVDVGFWAFIFYFGKILLSSDQKQRKRWHFSSPARRGSAEEGRNDKKCPGHEEV